VVHAGHFFVRFLLLLLFIYLLHPRPPSPLTGHCRCPLPEWAFLPPPAHLKKRHCTSEQAVFWNPSSSFFLPRGPFFIFSTDVDTPCLLNQNLLPSPKKPVFAEYWTDPFFFSRFSDLPVFPFLQVVLVFSTKPVPFRSTFLDFVQPRCNDLLSFGRASERGRILSHGVWTDPVPPSASLLSQMGVFRFFFVVSLFFSILSFPQRV